MPTVTITREDSVALVRYDRGAKANALSHDTILDLTRAAEELVADTTCHLVILAGTERRFSAGVDLEDVALWQPGEDSVARSEAMAAGGRMVDRWARLPQICIAAVEGPAIGGGAILALAADFRVMGEGSYFRFPEVRLGMTLGWGGLPLLTALVGPARAKLMLFTDARIEPGEAERLGLCERAVPAGGALEAARELAAGIAACPPMALRMTKRTVDSHCRDNWASGFEADQFFLSRLLLEETG